MEGQHGDWVSEETGEKKTVWEKRGFFSAKIWGFNQISLVFKPIPYENYFFYVFKIHRIDRTHPQVWTGEKKIEKNFFKTSKSWWLNAEIFPKHLTWSQKLATFVAEFNSIYTAVMPNQIAIVQRLRFAHTVSEQSVTK